MKLRLSDDAGRPLCEVCGRYFASRCMPAGRYAHLACLYPGSTGPGGLIPALFEDRDIDAVTERRQRAGLPALPPWPAALAPDTAKEGT